MSDDDDDVKSEDDEVKSEAESNNSFPSLDQLSSSKSPTIIGEAQNLMDSSNYGSDKNASAAIGDTASLLSGELSPYIFQFLFSKFFDYKEQ
jgi:hypothetical protein